MPSFNFSFESDWGQNNGGFPLDKLHLQVSRDSSGYAKEYQPNAYTNQVNYKYHVRGRVKK